MCFLSRLLFSVFPNPICTTQTHILNSRTPRDMKHFGNPKNENLLRGPKFYGENEFPVEMCIS